MTKDAIGASSFVLRTNERAMIKGKPGVILMARALAEHGPKLAEQARSQVAAEIHDRITDLARTTPTWEGMDDGIFVRQEGESIVTGFDPEHPQVARATELEFGTETQPPSSIFRKVLMGQRPHIERSFRRHLGNQR
jgi:hypothetical protein